MGETRFFNHLAAAAAAAMCARSLQITSWDSTYDRRRLVKPPSRYVPHQGAREKARRLRQVAA